MLVGFSKGNVPNGSWVGNLPNSYANNADSDFNHCWLAERLHYFDWPNGANKPTWKYNSEGGVVGCGLLLNSEKELSIFFTLNGNLLGQFLS
jgi:hypothetical protein